VQQQNLLLVLVSTSQGELLQTLLVLFFGSQGGLVLLQLTGLQLARVLMVVDVSFEKDLAVPVGVLLVNEVDEKSCLQHHFFPF